MASEQPRAAFLNQVSHRYSADVVALDRVSLSFGFEELVVLVGANGSGKSTLLKVLAGVETPQEGDVELLGEPRSRGSGVLGRDTRSRLSYLAQDLQLDPELSGRETLELIAVLRGLPRSDRRQRIAEVGETLGLTAILDRLVSTYSGGQRRRLHLALGVLVPTDLLLLDEPFAGLDDEASTFLWGEFERWSREGASVVLASHDLERAREVADRVVFLAAGKVVAQGAPQELASPGEGLGAAYSRLSGKSLGTSSSLGPGGHGGGGGGGAGRRGGGGRARGRGRGGSR